MSTFKNPAKSPDDTRNEPHGERSVSATRSTQHQNKHHSSDRLPTTNYSVVSRKGDISETTTPVSKIYAPRLRPVKEWLEEIDMVRRGGDAHWERVKAELAEEAQARTECSERHPDRTGVCLNPAHAYSVQRRSDLPVAELHLRCLKPFAAVATCDNEHENPVGIPCRGAWCERCRPQTLTRLLGVFQINSNRYCGADAETVRAAVGEEPSVITFSRVVGSVPDVLRHPERVERTRRALGKVIERLSERTDLLIRGDTLDIDGSGNIVLYRHVLLNGMADLGRIKNATVTVSGRSAEETVVLFASFVGNNWMNAPASKALAKVLLDVVRGLRRVGTFNGFSRLLRATDVKAECTDCHAHIEVRFLPTDVSPTLPVTREEFDEAVAKMPRPRRPRKRNLLGVT